MAFMARTSMAFALRASIPFSLSLSKRRAVLSRVLATILWPFLWLVLAAPLHAQDVQPVPLLSGRVVDHTGTLTSAQSEALSAKLSTIEHERGAQLVVLIVPSTHPEDIAAYAQRIGEAWKLGRQGVGDGLLIVVAKNDRKVRIEVAKALEGAVPDLAARQIIGERITPAFKAGDYAGGLNSAVDALAERIGVEGLPPPEKSSPGKPSPGFDLGDLGLFFLMAVPVIGAILTTVMGRKLGSFFTGGAAGVLSWLFTHSVAIALVAAVISLVLVGIFGLGTRRGGGPIVWGGGGSGSNDSDLSSGSFGGGDSFSSGGGGDFGGGGASGDW